MEINKRVADDAPRTDDQARAMLDATQRSTVQVCEIGDTIITTPRRKVLREG